MPPRPTTKNSAADHLTRTYGYLVRSGSTRRGADGNRATAMQRLVKTQLLNQTGLQRLVNKQHSI